jgi:hypothetical protein
MIAAVGPLCVQTARDISIIRQEGRLLVTACDTLGAIGSKPADVVAASDEICGAYTLRVCLNELAAVGVTPLFVLSLVCNEWEPTGRRVLDGIRTELTESGYPNLPVSGSSEQNMQTSMTGLGIALVGTADSLRWRQTAPGDRVVLVGLPWVGSEVLDHVGELLRPSVVRFLVGQDEVGDVIPCGSRGIRHELDVLEHEAGVRIVLHKPAPVDLDKSAGPATCALVTVHGSLADCGLRTTELGFVEERR